jgi:hypothetical protein
MLFEVKRSNIFASLPPIPVSFLLNSLSDSGNPLIHQFPFTTPYSLLTGCSDAAAFLKVTYV